MRLQDAMGYDEPPSLYASRRPALALAVLKVGEDHAGLPARAAAAAILREELSRLLRSPEALGLCAEARLPCSADADAALLSALRSAASPERVAVDLVEPAGTGRRQAAAQREAAALRRVEAERAVEPGLDVVARRVADRRLEREALPLIRRRVEDALLVGSLGWRRGSRRGKTCKMRVLGESSRAGLLLSGGKLWTHASPLASL